MALVEEDTPVGGLVDEVVEATGGSIANELPVVDGHLMLQGQQ